MTEAANPEIETLIAAFYAAFDNRETRRPSAEALHAMFAEGAKITRIAASGTERWAPADFIAPRIAMLTDGTLSDFHEWEVEADTTVRGDIASRSSRYQKSGRLDGDDYRGGGQKFIQLYRTDRGWLISAILWQDG